MAEAERFDLSKFAKSFFQVLPWVKTFRYAIGIGIVVGIFSFIYFKFKPNTQNTTFSGNVGKVNIIQANKRFFIPFIEAGIEQRNNSDMGTYIRAGLRVEF